MEDKRFQTQNLTLSQNSTPSPKPFEDFSLHFDDPTDDIMVQEAQDGSDELSVESSRRNDHKPKAKHKII